MPRIYVEFARLKQLGDSCKTVSSKVDGIRSDFQRTVSQLDWDVKFKSDINNTANHLARKLEGYTQALKDYQKFIAEAHDKYVKLDNEKFDDKLVDINSIIGGDSTSSGSESKAWWENLWDGTKKVVGDAVKWVSDTYTVFKPYIDTAFGVAEIAIGIGLLVTGNPLGILAITYGYDKSFGGITDIIDGDSGKGIKPIQTGFENLISWLGSGIGGETGALIGKSIGTLIYNAGDIATSLLTGNIADEGIYGILGKNLDVGTATDIVKFAQLFDNISDTKSNVDNFQDIYNTLLGDEESLLKLMANVFMKTSGGTGSKFNDELIMKTVESFIKDTQVPSLQAI